MVLITIILILLFDSLFGEIQINEVDFLDNISEYNNKYVMATAFIISNNLESISGEIKLSPFIYSIEEKIYIKLKIYTNTVFFAEDEVYVKIPFTEKSWNNALSNLTERTKILLKGESIEPYISQEDKELREKINNLSYDELLSLLEKDIGRVNSIQMISLMHLGYTYPLNLEVGFLDLFKTWGIKDIFHLGIGTSLIKIYPQLSYETNTAIAILPIDLFLPILINKKSNYFDLIINFEWAWYKDFSTTTNTNQNTLVTKPTLYANYIDLNIRFFLPYSIIKAGIHYNYFKDKLIFYAGIDIFVGKYSKQ